jgi:uncharacterized UPF0146 family protein
VHTEANVALVDRLARYATLVEVGVGRRPDVAAALADRGRAVTATDVRGRDVPACVRFVRDDVTDPDRSVYRGADAVYARNCPPELQRPLADVARAVDAHCLVSTLGADPVVVAATPEQLPERTLHRVHP